MTQTQAIEKVVSLALAEVGYLEKASNKDLDSKKANAGSGNYTKYSRDMDKLGYFNYPKQRVSWCAVFVHWLFVQCFGMANAQTMLYCGAKSSAAGCWLGADCFRRNNAFFSSPKVGDQIFFGKRGDEEHTGIVVDIKGGRVYTVEGNLNNAVRQQNYALSSSYISGYGRPKWSVVANDAIAKPTAGDKTKDETQTKPKQEVCSVYLNVLRKGSSGNSVKALQGILIANGFSCGRWGADGDFGADTLTAVRRYQAAKKLDVDGIVGQATWGKLLN